MSQLNAGLVAQLGFTTSEAHNLSSKLGALDNVRLSPGLRFIKGERGKDPLRNIFFLESLVALKQKGKSEKLQDLFVNHAERDEKWDLIDGFLFSPPYKFATGHVETRHVMFHDFKKDQIWIAQNVASSWTDWRKLCSSGRVPICFCIRWLQERQICIDPYLRIVVNNLYEMRCAVVHESFPVIFLPHSTSPGESETLRDAYPVGPKPDDFVTYEATIEPERFFQTAKNVAKRYLLSMI